MKSHFPLTLAVCAILGTGSRAAASQVTTIRVEIDYMEDGLHSHRPEQAEINAVIQMFACKGVTLIVDIDDAIGHEFVMGCSNPGVDNFFTCTNSTTSFATYANQFRDQGAGWHYCIFGHSYNNGSGTDSSGLGEILGDEFFVADGVIDNYTATPFYRASTFAHELGHNLGLKHASPSSSTNHPYSPNLASIMSYQYQLRGVKSRMECLGLVGNDHLLKELDYSSGRFPPLFESILDETRGSGARPVDWSCDGQYTSNVTKDLNRSSNWCSQGSGISRVYDYDEWSALVDVTSDPAFVNMPTAYETCAPVHDLMSDPGAGCPNIGPDLAIEACKSGRMVFIDPNTPGPTETGTGEHPYRFLEWINFSPSGSVIYLQPGTHKTGSGNGIVIQFPVVLTGPGGAVIDP